MVAHGKRRRLIERRTVMGLSQEGLAAAIEVDSSTVARWERGVTTPQPWHRPRLAHALHLSVEEVDVLLAGGEGPASSGSRADGTDTEAGHGRQSPEAAVGTLREEGVWQPDLDRVRAAAVALWCRDGGAPEPTQREDAARLVLCWLLASPEPAVSYQGRRRVGLGDVQRLHEVRRALKAVDDTYGGGTALPMAKAYLRQEAASLLYGCYDDGTGRALFGALAQATLDAGWMAYDAGDHRLAKACMAQTLRLSHAADDRVFGARVLTAMCHQALSLGQNRLAVDYARAARAGTRHAAPHRMQSMMAAMEAIAQAAVHEVDACLTALRDAELALGRSGDGQDPEWLDFDEGGLWGHAARAHRHLGDGKQCVRFAEQAITACRDDHGRTRAQRYAILAAGHTHHGAWDEAAAAGQRVVREAWRLRSCQVDEEITQLATLVRQRDPRGGHVFMAEVDDYLAARTESVTG